MNSIFGTHLAAGFTVIANFLLQRRLTQPSGLALVLILGSLALQVPALCEQRAGALEGFLALPESKWKKQPCYGAYQTAIPKYQKRFEEAERDYDKGIAVANLAVIALEMARKKKTRRAARDLCEQWVMPNLDTSLPIELSNSCAWRRNVMRCANLYRLTQDSQKERACLAMLYECNQREGDQDLAAYLLAYQYARSGKHHLAITVIRCLDPESKYAVNRDELIDGWEKQMRSQKKKEQAKQLKKQKARKERNL